MSKNEKSRNKNKNKKPYNKSNTRDKRDAAQSVRNSEDQPEKSDMNKLPWYMPNDVIASNYNYALEGMLGIPTNLSDVKDVYEELPTVCAIGLVNTPGDTSRDILGFGNPSMAAINVAAKNFYTKLSSENKKTTMYQPQDVALAILAENALVSLFASAVRLYGLGLQLNPKNRDVPRELIKGCGIDPDTFPAPAENTVGGMTLTEFRDAINVLAQAANALPFVGGIAEFEKSWALFVNYYVDDPIDMAQYYVPFMEKYMYYNEEVNPDDQSTLIKTMKYEDLGTPQSPISIRAFVNAIKKCIDNLVTSSLMNYVYPDILNFMLQRKATPFTFPLLSDMYVARPVYNETVLNQIHNAFVPGPITFGDITQDPTKNIIETHIQVQLDVESALMGQYVDFLFSNNPTLEEKIDSLMFRVAVRGESGTSPKYATYHATPDWVPVGVYFIGCGNVMHYANSTVRFGDGVSSELILSCISKFKAAPIWYEFKNADRSFMNTVGDLGNFGVMRYADVKPIYDQALLGLFTYDASRALKGDSK